MNELHEFTALCETCGCSVLYAEPLRNHTTFRIGGACTAFVNVNSAETLKKLLAYCRRAGSAYTILGNGSNVLAADSGFRGIVLHLGRDFSKITREDDRLHCEAGATLARIGKFALEESLTGMECLAGIPGTVGGALYMNAGAYGREMSDIIISAECMDENGTLSTVSKEEMQLGYRTSVFQDRHCIITGMTLQLSQGKYGEIKEEMDDLLGKRRAKQPLELPSAGSTFRRPVGNYASFLIDQCGLKGAKRGRCTGQQETRRLCGEYRKGHLPRCAGAVRLCQADGSGKDRLPAGTGTGDFGRPVCLKGK